jgi:hypothetical protein
LERSSLLTQDNLCPRESVLTTAATVVNQHTKDTNPIYVENLSTLEEKPRAEVTQIFFHYYQMGIQQVLL